MTFWTVSTAFVAMVCYRKSLTWNENHTYNIYYRSSGSLRASNKWQAHNGTKRKGFLLYIVWITLYNNEKYNLFFQNKIQSDFKSLYSGTDTWRLKCKFSCLFFLKKSRKANTSENLAASELFSVSKFYIRFWIWVWKLSRSPVTIFLFIKLLFSKKPSDSWLFSSNVFSQHFRKIKNKHTFSQ